MLKNVIDYINQKIETLNIIQERFGLCELITDGERQFPGEYCEGEYKTVSDFTDNKSVSYHRLNGDIGIDQNNEDSSNGCGVYTKKTYPLRSVFFLRKDIYKNNAYAEELIISNIEKAISSQNVKDLCQELNMEVVSIITTGTILDRNKLYKDEYNQDNMVGYEYAYFSILIDVIIEGNLNCQVLETC